MRFAIVGQSSRTFLSGDSKARRCGGLGFHRLRPVQPPHAKDFIGQVFVMRSPGHRRYSQTVFKPAKISGPLVRLPLGFQQSVSTSVLRSNQDRGLVGLLLRQAHLRTVSLVALGSRSSHPDGGRFAAPTQACLCGSVGNLGASLPVEAFP
jgi:hypothetical protein